LPRRLALAGISLSGGVFGLLWNCSDVLPGIRLHEPLRSRTYAAGARALKAVDG
jgi:hypothetical protein